MLLADSVKLSCAMKQLTLAGFEAERSKGNIP